MSKEYSKIARQIVELLEQIPVKRYGEINLVLAQELGLMLVDMREKRKAFQDLSIEEKNNLLIELQRRFGLHSFEEKDLKAFYETGKWNV